MSTSVPILAPDGQVRNVPQEQASAALAAGGKNVSKMIDPQGAMRWVPQEQVDAAQAQGGTPVNADGTWTITPAPNESFADTMKRAAAAGQNLTPQLQQQQTNTGLRDAPLALGAAAVAGPATLGTEAGAFDLAGSAVNLAKYYGGQALQNPVVQKAIKIYGPQLVSGAVKGAGWAGGGAATYKFLKSIGLIKGPLAGTP